MEADFQSVYHLELRQLLKTRTWRWFAVMLRGLLQVDSRVSRFFAPEPTVELQETETEHE